MLPISGLGYLASETIAERESEIRRTERRTEVVLAAWLEMVLGYQFGKAPLDEILAIR